jgi:uncharacterized membrane protein
MMILAHSEGGHGWGGPIEPWEIHPMLIHFPIAFLLGGVLLDLYAWCRGSATLVRIATGLLIAGVLTGLLTALAGWLAMETVPAHTEQAHELMQWHMYIQLIAVGLFVIVCLIRWWRWNAAPGGAARVLGWIAAIVISVGAGFGGYIVYHGGAGVMPQLLAPEVRESHEHHH